MKQYCNNCQHTYYTIPETPCHSCPNCGWHYVTIDTIMEHDPEISKYPSCPHYDELSDKVKYLNPTIFSEQEIRRMEMVLEVTLQNPEDGLGFAHNQQSPENICLLLGCKHVLIIDQIRQEKDIKKRRELMSHHENYCKTRCMFSASQFIEAMKKFDIVQLY